MVYVGTASRRSTDRETLASIIAGEAGNEGLRGMRAVGSVIQNRASQNFSNYGTDLVSQATARNQFQGQASPTSGSYQVADELLSGRLTDVTGGALYYANPGASTASWATRLDSNNALQIGNHFFTDNTQGRPFAGDGSATVQNADYTGGQNSDLFGGNNSGVAPGEGPLTMASPSTDPRWAQADINGDGDVTVTELKTYNEAQAAAKAANSADAGSQGAASSIPRAIVSAADQQSKAMVSAQESANKTAAANTAATNSANTGIWQGLQTWLGGRLLQIMVFVLAAIFVLVGLYMFAPKMSPIPSVT